MSWKEFLAKLPASKPKRYKCVHKGEWYSLHRKTWRTSETNYQYEEYRKCLKSDGIYRKGEIYGQGMGFVNALIQECQNKLMVRYIFKANPLLKLLCENAAKANHTSEK